MVSWKSSRNFMQTSSSLSQDLVYNEGSHAGTSGFHNRNSSQEAFETVGEALVHLVQGEGFYGRDFFNRMLPIIKKDLSLEISLGR